MYSCRHPSRSYCDIGSTGLPRQAATELSVFLAIPTMLAATVLDAYKALVILSLDDVPVFAVGFVTSFIFAMLAIKGLLHFLSPQLQRLRLVPHCF
ncbi:MAG: undecaprenyl-diphosphate phosphatase [Chromatiaceae bacterium]